MNPGRPSAAALQQIADQAASDAEIVAIAEGDSGREQVAAEYGHLARATLTNAGELPADVRVRLATHLDKIRALTTAGEQLRRGIPTPKLSREIGPHTSQHSYDPGTVGAVLASAEQNVRRAAEGMDEAAAAIIRDAWLGAVPVAPDRALAGRVAAGVTAIHAATAAGQKPADILQRALATDDRVLVYALLGSVEGKSLLTALGTDHTALAEQYGRHLLARGERFPGADFLAAQQDAQRSLAALRQKALGVYEAQHARAQAVLRTRAVARRGA